jgi:hypothetical protein
MSETSKSTSETTILGIDPAADPDRAASFIAEIVGPSGRVHYRRSPDDPLVADAGTVPGYSVRFVSAETMEGPKEASDDAE